MATCDYMYLTDKKHITLVNIVTSNKTDVVCHKVPFLDRICSECYEIFIKK